MFHRRLSRRNDFIPIKLGRTKGETRTVTRIDQGDRNKGGGGIVKFPAERKPAKNPARRWGVERGSTSGKEGGKGGSKKSRRGKRCRKSVCQLKSPK